MADGGQGKQRCGLPQTDLKLPQPLAKLWREQSRQLLFVLGDEHIHGLLQGRVRRNWHHEMAFLDDLLQTLWVIRVERLVELLVQGCRLLDSVEVEGVWGGENGATGGRRCFDG